MMSIICLKYIILYAKYLAKMLRMVQLLDKKCSETGPKRRCSDPEQYQYSFRYYL